MNTDRQPQEQHQQQELQLYSTQTVDYFICRQEEHSTILTTQYTVSSSETSTAQYVFGPPRAATAPYTFVSTRTSTAEFSFESPQSSTAPQQNDNELALYPMSFVLCPMSLVICHL